MRQPETDMIERIFTATDQLMANQGLANLSMHKIARQANISPGTIYLYFKNKDELLHQFAQDIFQRFQDTLRQNNDETLSFFERYRQMWWNVWHFLQANPSVLANIRQYESLPHFEKLCQEWEERSFWKQFCELAAEAGELCDLPYNVLFLLGIKSAIEMALKAKNYPEDFSVDLLESVIVRTWQAMKK